MPNIRKTSLFSNPFSKIVKGVVKGSSHKMSFVYSCLTCRNETQVKTPVWLESLLSHVFVQDGPYMLSHFEYDVYNIKQPWPRWDAAFAVSRPGLGCLLMSVILSRMFSCFTCLHEVKYPSSLHFATLSKQKRNNRKVENVETKMYLVISLLFSTANCCKCGVYDNKQYWPWWNTSFVMSHFGLRCLLMSSRSRLIFLSVQIWLFSFSVYT